MHVKEGYFFTPPKRVSSPTWCLLPPFKQAVKIDILTSLLYLEHKGQIAKIVISTYVIPGNETVGDYLVNWLCRSLFAKAKVGNVYLGPVYMEVWECR